MPGGPYAGIQSSAFLPWRERLFWTSVRHRGVDAGRSSGVGGVLPGYREGVYGCVERCLLPFTAVLLPFYCRFTAFMLGYALVTLGYAWLRSVMPGYAVL